MPLATSAPTAPTTVIPNNPKIVTNEATSIVVDTKYTPLSSLITYIAGASWTVNYFSQILTKDNDLRAQDVGQSALYQQYTAIRGMELKVTNPLTQAQDSQTKRMTVTGSAIVYPFLKPNEGDMFAADAGDGREAVFRIRTSERKSHLRESVYQIEYELVYYSDANKENRKDLEVKSVRTFFYRKDFLQNGQNPLLVEDDSNSVNELTQKFSEIVLDYFSWFFNKDTNTLMVPGQAAKTYDHYLTTCVLGILTTRDAPEILYVRRLNVESNMYIKQAQLFEALLRKDKDLLLGANWKMGTVSTMYFARDPALQSISFSGALRLVYPINPDKSLINANDAEPLVADEALFNAVPTSGGDLNNIITNADLEEVNIPPLIHKVSIDDYYVFSKAFYEDTEGKSLLEVLTTDYLDNKAISVAKLLELANSYKRWGGLEKFYYMVVLLVLIKSTIRGL